MLRDGKTKFEHRGGTDFFSQNLCKQPPKESCVSHHMNPLLRGVLAVCWLGSAEKQRHHEVDASGGTAQILLEDRAADEQGVVDGRERADIIDDAENEQDSEGQKKQNAVRLCRDFGVRSRHDVSGVYKG